MTKSKKYTVDEFFGLLTKESFALFYGEEGMFDDFLGGLNGPTDVEVKEELERLLNGGFHHARTKCPDCRSYKVENGEVEGTHYCMDCGMSFA